jgi:glycosyltransferase involved in cell wall biosynthesis
MSHQSDGLSDEKQSIGHKSTAHANALALQPSHSLLTLLFPLYRSKQFIDNLRKHFNQITNPRFNIVVSDRHCYDDCLEILRNEYAHDTRFSFHAETDGIKWVEHYNFLIGKVTGKYFTFVPHDDNYHPDYFDTLVAELENRPSASLAFSEMFVAGDNDWVPDYRIFKKNYRYPFTAKQYFALLYSNIIGVAFRGVFRSSIVQKENLLIRESPDVTMYQDYYWIFALLERGDFIYTEKTSCTKLFRKDGASGKWDYTRFFKKNKAARKILYAYTFASPLPLITRWKIYTGLESRVLKVRLSRKLQKIDAALQQQ